MKSAFVVGASGSVGKALIQELVNQGSFSPIVTFGRSAQHVPGVTEILLPMNPKDLEAAVLREAAKIDHEIVGFSVLGVGAHTAQMTLDEHRAIDVELNRAFAKGLKETGKVRHLNFMSAVGASLAASSNGPGAAGFPRYSRVKGESEAAVSSAGLEVVSIFRPSMIIGSAHTPSVLAEVMPWFSFLTPKNFLPIRTNEIARSMIAAASYTPVNSEIYHYPEMMTWIQRQSN